MMIHAVRIDLRGGTGREEGSRELKDCHDPTRKGEHQTSGCNQPHREQGPPTSVGGDACLLVFFMIYTDGEGRENLKTEVKT